MSREIQSVPITFANTGIVIKSAADEIPMTAYKLLSNAQTDKENSVSVRKGFTRLNSGLPDKPHSAYFLKDYNNRQWRYAIVDGQLYVAPVSDPNDASIWPIAMSNEFGAVSGGSNLSDEQDPRALFATYSLYGSEQKPYIFLADATTFLKHSGGMASARRVGIPAPINAIIDAVASSVADELLEDFEDYTEWTGGDSTGTTAPDYPSVWNYSSSTLDARQYYAKYAFVLNDGTETFASSSLQPHYIKPGKSSRMFWKPYEFSYEEGDLAQSDLGPGTYFNEAVGDFIPDGARLIGVRIFAADHIHRISTRWSLPDGTIEEGAHHGGGEGTEYLFSLDFDEYITSITGTYGLDGGKIDTLQFVTNKRTSQVYGGNGGDGPNPYDLSVPADAATYSYDVVGFHGKYGLGGSAYEMDITDIGLVFRKNTFDASATAPGTAVGWNLYVGEDQSYLRKVNSTPIDLGSYYDEPTDGFDYLPISPTLPNVGDISNDPAGNTGNAVQIDITGSGVSGSFYKIFTNEIDYPVVKDLGIVDPNENIKIAIKLHDAEAKLNCAEIKIKFVISDLAGDIGDKYQYYAIASITDFSSYVAGTWYEETISKSDFIFVNYSGVSLPNLGWSTVTAVEIEVITTDPASGGETCNVSFDDLYYSPIGQLTGSDFQWTFTYYNSRTGTESDFAELFVNPLGALSNNSVTLTLPSTPYTNPPLADPDKIRLYRMGGTVEQFQLVKEVDYIPGFSPTITDNIPDDLLGDLLELDNQLPPDAVSGCEIYDNRLWTWGGSYNGVAEPLNRLRFSKPTRVELFPEENRIQVGSGNEQIQRVLEHDGELFVFTLTKVYRIVGQSLATYRAVSTAVNQGLTNKFCAVRGTRGLFMRAYDGIYEFPSGKKISEPINQIFFDETVNGIEPIAEGREQEEAMGFYDSKLFFCYCSTTDTDIRNDRTLIYDTLYNRWFWYIYGAQGLFTEPENNILVGCNLTQWYNKIAGSPVDVRYSGNYPMKLEDGYADQCSDGFKGIPCIIDTKEYDLGAPDQEKQFIDLTVDADTQGYPIAVQMSFDGEDHELLGIVQTTERARTVLPILLEDANSRNAVRASLRITFESDVNATSSTRIYKVAHRILIEPPRHGSFVTDWSNYGHPGPKYFQDLWIEMDTFNNALESIEVQIDGEVIATLTENITANGRKKLYYGIGIDKRGTLARLKINVVGDNEVKVYDHGFNFIPEPALLNTWQSEWTDVGFPYRKLWKHIELDIDTEGAVMDFDFWLDGEIVQTFALTTDNRAHRVVSIDQEQFGKLGRITLNADAVDADGNVQGVRIYSPPIFVVEQRNPDVTIADSFEYTLDNERMKVLRKMWHVIDNPNENVTLQVYIDNTLKGTFTIAASNAITPKLLKRRIDFPSGFKGRLMRFVFTSGQAFEIDWAKSYVDVRDLNVEDGYRKGILRPPSTY